jgi:hypothetical protein
VPSLISVFHTSGVVSDLYSLSTWFTDFFSSIRNGTRYQYTTGTPSKFDLRCGTNNQLHQKFSRIGSPSLDFISLYFYFSSRPFSRVTDSQKALPIKKLNLQRRIKNRVISKSCGMKILMLWETKFYLKLHNQILFYLVSLLRWGDASLWAPPCRQYLPRSLGPAAVWAGSQPEQINRIVFGILIPIVFNNIFFYIYTHSPYRYILTVFRIRIRRIRNVLGLPDPSL